MNSESYEPPPLTLAEPGSRWSTLAALFPTTGRWPIHFDGAHRIQPWQAHHLWRQGERTPCESLREQFGLDKKDEWATQEDDYCFACGTVTDRSGELAIGDESNDLALLESFEDRARSLPLALVGVADPADCLAELGWSGAINAGMVGADARVVLKSWQARFGAYVHSAWGGSLEMRVTRPPRSVAEARLVAREHFHFCRYDSQFHGTGGIGPYVEGLVGNTQWRFWWD